MSINSKTKEDYPFDKKKKLAAKISDMRNREHLKVIKNIIFNENPEITARKSNHGYLMYFQNYTDETYYKIENFLNKIERIKLEKQAKSITDSKDRFSVTSDEQCTDYNVTRTRLRYSNRERRLIKRRQYEKIIGEKITDDSNVDKITSNDPNNDPTNDDPNSENNKIITTVKKRKDNTENFAKETSIFSKTSNNK